MLRTVMLQCNIRMAGPAKRQSRLTGVNREPVWDSIKGYLTGLRQFAHMAGLRKPTLTRGSNWLALRLVGLHGLSSLVASVPAIAILTAVGIVEKSHMLPIGLVKLGVPAFLAGKIDTAIFGGAAAALMVLIAVIAMRGIIVSAAGGHSTVDVDASSYYHPVLNFAFRKSWLVLLIVGAVYVTVHMSGGAVAHYGPRSLIFIGVAIVIMLLSMLGQPLSFILVAIFLGIVYALGRVALVLFRETLIHFGAVEAVKVDVGSVAKAKWGQLIRLVFNLLILFGCPFILLQSWLPRQIFGARPIPTFSQVEHMPASGVRIPAPDNLFFDISDMPMLFETAYQYSMVGLGMILIAFAAAVIWIQAAEVARGTAVAEWNSGVVQRAPRENDPRNALEAILRRPSQDESRAFRPAAGAGVKSFGRRGIAG